MGLNQLWLQRSLLKFEIWQNYERKGQNGFRWPSLKVSQAEKERTAAKQ